MKDISKNIIERAARGDAQAFDILYRATADFIYTIVFRITNNHDNAEDITQDVFIKIYKNLKSFHFYSSFKTWAYRIAVNTAINACRKEAKNMEGRDEYIFDMTRYPSQGGALDDNKNVDEQRIASLLALLNPDQRACIVLREIEGLNYKEIAEVLNVNINTVRSRLKRAREALLGYKKREEIKHELPHNTRITLDSVS
ncbi:MAG: RNA polymerase sigma factor [bacterium]